MKTALLAALCAVTVVPPLSAQEQAKIENALSAAPASISQEATVKDWDQTVLREGTNGWTCLPDMPETSGNDPMCLDSVWMEWVDAYVNKKPFEASRVGFGYMLTGDSPASNVDPYATGPTEDNEWLSEGMPHIMMLVPDPAMLSGIPTHPSEGGPWVMWRDTPYVHVMLPVSEGSGTHGEGR